MPEGDVVWRTARRLDAALVGEPLVVADLRWPSLATSDLTAWTVREVLSRGKHMLTRLTPPDDLREAFSPLTLHSHLRMEGTWQVHRTGERRRRGREADVRVILATREWTAVGLRLGMLDLAPTADEASLVGHLGPDLLGPDWDLEQALANLRRDPHRPVGEALLDQRVLAGVGTFFMAETMFLRGFSPWTPVADLDQAEGALAATVERAQRLLQSGCRNVSQSTTGDTRPGQESYVHGRSGRPCRRCGTLVRVAPIGQAPTERVAFYCPTCQAGPTPTDDGRRQAPLGARPASADGGDAPGSRRGAARGQPRRRERR